MERASDGAAEARRAGRGTAAPGHRRARLPLRRLPGTAPVLVLRHAAKSFGAVQALIDGSIELYPGEAHALVGENGAGKSTLVKILAGVYQPDAGSLLGGRPRGHPARPGGGARGRASRSSTRSPRCSPT